MKQDRIGMHLLPRALLQYSSSLFTLQERDPSEKFTRGKSILVVDLPSQLPTNYLFMTIYSNRLIVLVVMTSAHRKPWLSKLSI